MTNLTPAQLEQFESTFRYFDKDESQTLSITEMTAALASLGIVYSDEDLDFIYAQLTEDYGAVTFEAFINLLVIYFIVFAKPMTEVIFQVDITEDQTSPEQLRESFRGIATDKVCCCAKVLLLLTVRMRSHSLLSWTCGLHICPSRPSITCGRLCRRPRMKRASLNMTMSAGWMMFSHSNCCRIHLNETLWSALTLTDKIT
jgi:hypothetical protein